MVELGDPLGEDLGDRPGLRWGIIGLEGGPEARPGDWAWVRAMLRQIKTARLQGSAVQPFLKQLGACGYDEQAGIVGARFKVNPDVAEYVHRRLTDPAGGDESEWPEDLRGHRHFPTPST